MMMDRVVRVIRGLVTSDVLALSLAWLPDIDVELDEIVVGSLVEDSVVGPPDIGPDTDE